MPHRAGRVALVERFGGRRGGHEVRPVGGVRRVVLAADDPVDDERRLVARPRECYRATVFAAQPERFRVAVLLGEDERGEFG